MAEHTEPAAEHVDDAVAIEAPDDDYIEAAISAVRAIPPHRGQQTVFTPTAIRKLMAALERGHFLEPACHYAGISYRTFRRWMAEGQDDETEQTPQWAIWHAAQRAQAIWENAALGRLDDAAKTPRFYMADIIRLSRRHRDRWADSVNAQTQIAPGVAIGLQVSVLTPVVPPLPQPTFAPTERAVSNDLHRLTADTASHNNGLR